MAEHKKISKQKGQNEKRGINFVFLSSAFAVALLMLVTILGGIMYFVVKANLYGVAEKYKKQIENIPIISSALPQKSEEELTLEQLSWDEILERYKELLTEHEKLEAELKNALEVSENLNNLVLDYRKREEDLKNRENSIAEREEMLKKDKDEFQRRAALEDKQGFSQFYQGMDPEQAKEIYSMILEEQKKNNDAKEFARYYQNMEASAAAAIFENLGTSQVDIVVDVLKNMGRENASQILQEMDPQFASMITKKLSEFYLK